MTIGQKHLGGAVKGHLTSAMAPTTPGVGGSFTVDDRSNWPPSGVVPAKIDAGTDSEEKVLLSDTSTTSFVVSQRGYDGTTARDHSIGATVELCLPAAVIQSMIDHVDDVETDPHSTKLLNNARHDVTARHTFGAALGTPGTPVALTPDIAGAAGTGTVPSRSDHVHNVPAAAATSITGTNAEGSGSSFARNDHNHQIAGTNHIPGAALVNDSVTSTQAATAVPAALTETATAAEGASASLALADHVHATDVLSWGYMGSFSSTASTALLTTTQDTDMTFTFTTVTNRRYLLFGHGTASIDDPATWDVSITVGGSQTHIAYNIGSLAAGGTTQPMDFACLYTETSGQSRVFVLRAIELGGTAGFRIQAAANDPRQFWAVDVST